MIRPTDSKTDHAGIVLLNDGKKIWVDDNSEDILFFESFSQRFFVSTWANVYAAFYHINRNFRLRSWVDMNEIFEFLGLSEFYIGSKYGLMKIRCGLTVLFQ